MIYTTRNGKKIDTRNWPEGHKKFLRKAYVWYYQDVKYIDFVNMIFGASSPVLKLSSNGPEPTKTTLYEAVTDLQFRLGVKQGHFSKDWEGDVEPIWPIKE